MIMVNNIYPSRKKQILVDLVSAGGVILKKQKMKGIPHSSTKVTGELRDKAIEIYMKERFENNKGYVPKGLWQYNNMIGRLMDEEMRLNQFVSFMDKLGYKLEIKIIKK